jgi:CheY-like chemotaxis protein
MRPDARLPILLVEDEPDLREDLAALLEEEGFEVRAAVHGAEALRILGAGYRPAVIVLDLMLPVMDGWETRARLLADRELADIPVLIVSGIANDEAEVAPLRAAAYLTKPVTMQRLIDAIHAARR